jgi:hypothetical protein
VPTAVTNASLRAKQAKLQPDIALLLNSFHPFGERQMKTYHREIVG